MKMANTNPIELDEILSRIAMVFSTNPARNAIAETNRQFRDNISINRATRAGAMIQGAMERYRLTKFSPVTSMDQKIREVVPPFWILATAMSNHATSQARREEASMHVGARYETSSIEDANDPEFRRIESEGHLYIQYVHYPDKTLRQFFQKITDKVHSNLGIDVTRFFNPAAAQTAPELLRLTFTPDEMDFFGW